jgi:hypothetical protein
MSAIRDPYCHPSDTAIKSDEMEGPHREALRRRRHRESFGAGGLGADGEVEPPSGQAGPIHGSALARGALGALGISRAAADLSVVAAQARSIAVRVSEQSVAMQAVGRRSRRHIPPTLMLPAIGSMKVAISRPSRPGGKAAYTVTAHARRMPSIPSGCNVGLAWKIRSRCHWVQLDEDTLRKAVGLTGGGYQHAASP